VVVWCFQCNVFIETKKASTDGGGLRSVFDGDIHVGIGIELFDIFLLASHKIQQVGISHILCINSGHVQLVQIAVFEFPFGLQFMESFEIKLGFVLGDFWAIRDRVLGAYLYILLLLYICISLSVFLNDIFILHLRIQVHVLRSF